MFVKQTADDLNDGHGDNFRRILPHFRRVRRLGEFQAGIQRLNDANVDVGEVGVFAVGHAHAHFVRSGHFGRVRIGHADETARFVECEFAVFVARDDGITVETDVDLL